MTQERIRAGALVGATVLGVIASASFAADQFSFFSYSEKPDRGETPFYFEGGALQGGAHAPSTEDLLLLEQYHAGKKN